MPARRCSKVGGKGEPVGQDTSGQGQKPGGHLLICDCEGSMTLDEAAFDRGLPQRACHRYTHLCRSEAEAAINALSGDAPVTIACGQEAAFFEELAEEQGATDRLTCVDIRDRAGWSEVGAQATPKMLALLAEAALLTPSAPAMPVTSEGVCLVYGAGQAALDAAARLADVLSVTCILTDADDAMPRRTNDFPIHAGQLQRRRAILAGSIFVSTALPILSRAGVEACALENRAMGPVGMRYHCRSVRRHAAVLRP
jgi:hypothetical protein